MDPTRFADLVRTLARAGSRRQTLGALLGGTSALLLEAATGATPRRPAGPRKKKKCKKGKTRCGKACVNTVTDPDNCGGCGNQCNSTLGEGCVNGACTAPPPLCMCEAGCCDANNSCLPGDSDQACGIGGHIFCRACVAPETCGGGGLPGVCGDPGQPCGGHCTANQACVHGGCFPITDAQCTGCACGCTDGVDGSDKRLCLTLLGSEMCVSSDDCLVGHACVVSDRLCAQPCA